MNEDCGENGCPYCHEGWGCPHEFILTEDDQIVGDSRPEIYDLLIQKVETVFNELRESGHPSPEWKEPWVTNLWETASEHTPSGSDVLISDLVGEQEIVEILCDLASGLPQASSERAMIRDDTPGLTGIGEKHFCENVETATEIIEQKISEILIPSGTGPNK